MKLRYLSALFLALLLASAAAAQSFDREVSRSLDEFSSAFLAAHPGIGMRSGLAVLDLEELSDSARKARVGTAVATRLAEGLDRSLAFILVDRKNLDRILKEAELSLSGLVAEGSSPAAGKLEGVMAWISGSVSEEGDAFRISLSLTDGETGSVLSSRSFSLPRALLIKVATDLQYQYVAKYGIGLSLSALIPIAFWSSDFNKSQPTFLDALALYRPSRYLQLGGGFLGYSMGTGELFRDESNLSNALVQPGLPDPAAFDYWGISGFATGFNVNQVTARYIISLAHLDAQYTLNILPWINLGFSGGALFWLQDPEMLVDWGGDHSGLWYRQQLAGQDPLSPDPTDYYSMPYQDKTEFRYLFQPSILPGFRAELRPELFLSPRLALYAKAGYLWMPTLQVREIHASHADWFFYQEGKSPAGFVPDPAWNPASPAEEAYALEQYSSWLYYGFNPLRRPDGSLWSLDLSMAYFQAGLSFYF